MNTDKIYAESIAKEYAPKDNSRIIALKKLALPKLRRRIAEEEAAKQLQNA